MRYCSVLESLWKKNIFRLENQTLCFCFSPQDGGRTKTEERTRAARCRLSLRFKSIFNHVLFVCEVSAAGIKTDTHTHTL